MNWSRFRCISVVPFGLGVALLMGLGAMGAQAPGGPPAPKQEPVPERDRLIRQAEELRQAGKLDNLGMVQSKLREYAAAKQSLEQALAIRRKSLPPDHPDIAGTLNNLGLVQSALRQYAAAKQSHEQALAICRKSLPPDHPDIAQSLNNLGLVQSALREYAAAKQSHEQALAICRKSLPPDHPDIATSLNNLGMVQSALREYAAAKQSHEQALAICRKSLPSDHPDIATSLNNLGLVQSALREYAAAKQSHEQALAIRRKSLPKDHPDIAQSLSNLGMVQTALREYAAAKQSYEQALAICRKSLPPDHPLIATSLNNLGTLQSELREYAAAKHCYQEALAICRKSLPPDHPDIATSLNNLGIVQDELREYAAAKQSHEQALAICRKSLPPDHPDIATSLNNLGLVQSALREYAAAKQSHEQALAIRRKSLPPDHPDIAQSLDNLGTVQSALGEHAAAKQCHEQALAIRRKSLPPDHPDIAFSLHNLGLLGLKSGVGVGDAVPGLAEATDLFQAEQLRLAVAQAEQGQLATAALAKISLGNLVSATLITRAEPASAYDRVVRVKGSVTAQQRWARQARSAADPDTTRLLDRLRQVTWRIVGLSMDKRRAQSKSNLRDMPDEIRTLSAERDELERQLTERSAAYRTIQARARVGSGEVRAALPEGSALIDLVDYSHLEPPAKGQTEPSEERRMVAFVVRPERQEVVIVPLGPSQALAKWIDRWRASYGAGKTPPAGETDPGAELRKRLWEPLAKHLEGVKVVLVSPDGPLHGLPWAALPGSKQGTFLVHEYGFAVVPVPQLLPELLRGKPRLASQQPSLLLAGGIDFGQKNTRDEGRQPAGCRWFPCTGHCPGPRRRSTTSAPSSRTPSRAARRRWSCERTKRQRRQWSPPYRRISSSIWPPKVTSRRRGWARPWLPSRTRGRSGRSTRSAVRGLSVSIPACSPGWCSPGLTGRTGVRKRPSSPRRRSPSWTSRRWRWSSSARATRVVVRWSAARGCWACSAPFSSPGRVRCWPAYGTWRTRRRTN